MRVGSTSVINWVKWLVPAIFLLNLGINYPKESPPLIPICTLQGIGFYSPYAGQPVRTQGVVYADLDETSKNGFFMQHPNCDGDASTSDGIFVYLGENTQVVNTGDLVEVSGTAWEYYGLTEVIASPAEVIVLSQGNNLPGKIELNPPFSNQLAREYYESMEGMHVKLSSGRVVGPTNSYDRTWLVRTDLNIWHVFHDDPEGTGELICLDDSGLYELEPEAKVGDLVNGLVGALDYTYGDYRVQALSPPTLVPANADTFTPINRASETLGFWVATFNLGNLFDTSTFAPCRGSGMAIFSSILGSKMLNWLRSSK